ncbi:MAG: hypothetical protein AB1742_11870 [bacterium]
MLKKAALLLTFAVLVPTAAERFAAQTTGAKGAVRTPLWSPDGKRAAFVYEAEGNLEAYVVTVGDNRGRNLSRTPGVERDLAWSPDGKTLLFASERQGNLDICAVNVETEEEKCLTRGVADEFWPVWRPDGAEIAYCSYENGRGSVYIIGAGGGDARRFYGPESCYPTWAPNGKKIALAYNGDIVVVDVESGREKNITVPLISGEWVEDTLPFWSPRKDRIAFVGRYESFLTEIYTLSGGGKKLARISDNVHEEFRPQWSPDGKWLTYAAYLPGRTTTEIFASRQDGTERVRLTDNYVFDTSPSYSPDGGKVLFVRRERGRDALYVMNADGTDQKPFFPEGFIPEGAAQSGKERGKR